MTFLCSRRRAIPRFRQTFPNTFNADDNGNNDDEMNRFAAAARTRKQISATPLHIPLRKLAAATQGCVASRFCVRKSGLKFNLSLWPAMRGTYRTYTYVGGAAVFLWDFIESF